MNCPHCNTDNAGMQIVCEFCGHTEAAPSSCTCGLPCSVSCEKCGDTDILKRYIEPKPVYSGGSYRGKTKEYMAYRCQSCGYVWRGPTKTQNAK